MHLCSVKATDKVETQIDNEHEDRGQDSEEEGARAWDDVNGVELDPTKVMTARKLELFYIDEKQVWVKGTRSAALRKGKS